MSKHDHLPSCTHENVKYCKVCDVCHCTDCNKEWSTYRFNYQPWYTNTGGAGTGTQPNWKEQWQILCDNQTSCKHEV